MEGNVKIVVSAGEVSGDGRAAPVVRALRRRFPDAEFRGMGGRLCAAEGLELVADLTKGGAVMGVTELFGSFGRILAARRVLVRLLDEWRPDVVVVVDLPDFNLSLARAAARRKVPVYYYVPPKVWAWRRSRLFSMQRTVSAAGAIFPFEPAFHARHGFTRTEFVGHPFHEESRLWPSPSRASAPGDARPLVALLPGSRGHEVDRHLPVMLDALDLLRSDPAAPAPAAVVVVPDARYEARCRAAVGARPDVEVRVGGAVEAMARADVGLLKSGTCNLEAAYLGLPFVCVYRAGAVTAAVVRAMVRLKEFSIVNVLRPGTVPELLQSDLTAGSLADAARALMPGRPGAAAQQAGFAEITASLAPKGGGTSGAADRVAAAVAGLIRNPYLPFGTAGRVFSYLKPYRRTMAAAVASMALFGASDAVIPFLIRNVLDTLLVVKEPGYLLFFPLLLVGLAFVRAGADFGQQYLSSKVGHLVVRDLRGEMNERLLSLGADFYVARPAGDILSRVSGDVLLVRSLLTDSATSVVRDSVRLVVLLPTAVYLDPFLAMVGTVVVPLGVLPVVVLGRRMRDLSRRGQSALGALGALLLETMHGNRVVKVFGAERFERERFAEENERLTRTFVRSEKVRALTGPVNEVLASFMIAGIVWYGMTLVSSGSRTPGGFVAFLIAVYLFYDPLKKLGRVSTSVQQGLAAAQRVFEILDARPSVVDPPTPARLGPGASVRFENVSFRYESSETPVLREISLEIAEGTKVALVGHSGSGKSTLVDCIPRFVDPTEGRVLVGGTDVRTVTQVELRSRIAMVGQYTFLFNDTVLANVRYGRQSATRAEVADALRRAYAEDFVARLPRGLDTVIGEGGFSLSGGERQRLAIARAVLKDAPLLLLDEATASLDTRSELAVQRALEELEKNRTTVVVAHRLSTVADADQIVVLHDGRVVERGTHATLLAEGGAYAALHAAGPATARRSAG